MEEEREELEEKKGIGIKVFGVSLFLIGSLNTMLFWRGGLSDNIFGPSIILAGIALFIIGTIRGIDN